MLKLSRATVATLGVDRGPTSRAGADAGALAEPERDGADAVSDRAGHDGAHHRCGRQSARRPLGVHGARAQSRGCAAAGAQRHLRHRLHPGRPRVARRSVPRGHRPDRRLHQHGRPAGGGGRLSRDLRQAHHRTLRRKGAGDLAVRPAGVLLQPADQDARRSQDAARALVHAVDVEADRGARRHPGVDPVPGSLSVAAARRRELRRDLADLGQYRQVAGGHLAPAAALGVGLDPGAPGQRGVVREAHAASSRR